MDIDLITLLAILYQMFKVFLITYRRLEGI